MDAEKYCSRNSHIKQSDIAIVSILILAFALRIAWLVCTNLTAEDAFITFQYARRISQGAGFVYNLGEKICGTTTPLFSLLLALWISVFGEGTVVLGARLYSFAASISSLFFLVLSLRFLGFTTVQQGFALSLLVIWPKLWGIDTSGMETSLVVFLITVSWYTYLTKRNIWTGVLLGLLLWTRIDALNWVLLMIGFQYFRNPKESIKTLSAAVLTFSPWLIFALFYFGSPIPYTIHAKQIAYSKFNTVPFYSHFFTLIKKLGPVNSLSFPGNFTGLAAILTYFILILAIAASYISRKNRNILLLFVFSISELLLLTFTKATFTGRYLIPALYFFLFFAGLLLGKIWEKIKTSLPLKSLFALVVTGMFLYILSLGVIEAEIMRNLQLYNHEKSLKRIGEWLNENTDQDATVMLEPLGYAGYYADRRMLDVVGLITPPVVDLKDQGLLNPYEYIPSLAPDYLVVHCDDILRWLEQEQDNNTRHLDGYRKVITINPLDFDPTNTAVELTMDLVLSRNACYEIWESQ